jgi:hypothetical protein
MDENYRLFFNIRPLQLEVVEEEISAKGRFEDKEGEDEEYEDEVGGDDEFEDKVFEKGLFGEVEPDEEETNIEGKPLAMKTVEHVGAEGDQISKLWRGTHSAAITVSVLSAFQPSAQPSSPEIIQYESQDDTKPDPEALPELALFLQSLRQTEKAEFNDEINSEVCTVLSENCELDLHTIFELTHILHIFHCLILVKEAQSSVSIN